MKILLKLIAVLLITIVCIACKQPTESNDGSLSNGGTNSIPTADHYAVEGVTPSLQGIIDLAKNEETIAITGTFAGSVTVDKTLTFVGYGANGGIISGGVESVITVNATDQTVTIGDNITITNGYSKQGAGVNVIAGNFVLDGGTITDNHSPGVGGGVALTVGGATFTMNSGTISNNFAAHGGGVFIQNALFTMNSGTISNNKAFNGGGIFISRKAIVNLFAGEIQNSNAFEGFPPSDIQLGSIQLSAAESTIDIAPGFKYGPLIDNR